MLAAVTGARQAICWAPGVVALALLLAVSVADAAVPAGPRLAVVKETWSPQRVTLLTVDPNGRRPRRIAGGQENSGPVEGFDRLAWRADGTEIAFAGLLSLYLARVDGRDTRELNLAGAERPVFSPDGSTLVFTRFGRGNASIWSLDLATWKQRRLTPPAPGVEYVGSSFSPDGGTLLATRIESRRRFGSNLIALDLERGGRTRVLRDGFAPVYSPDGSKVAFFREVGRPRVSDLFVLDLASRAVRRLTRTPQGEELYASWDPSGQRIAFARFRPRHREWANSIVQINADGSCETEVLAQRRTVFSGVAWQPGPGREAGRIGC